MRQRHARADDEGGEARDRRRIPLPGAQTQGRLEGGGLVVEGQRLRADALERPDQGKAASGHPQNPDRPTREALDPPHRRHRSFNVESPTRARIEAMIQKRMTMVGSCHPFFSK